MTLQRSDYDQAARYLQHACELLDRQAPGKLRATVEVLRLAIRGLSPGDHFVGYAAAEITVLRHVAEQVPIADARTEILKAVAVLRDRV
jgi:predicted component of type VI protein secretion system